jgi:predicted nicotinamide N-methyase
VYWAKLWPPVGTMCELVANARWPAGTTVLELGCGIGVVGLAALAAGCRVTFSDYVPIAVELALANAEHNGFPSARGLVLDWKQPRDERFDVILGSDILYDKQNYPALVDLVDRMLQPLGTVWIGDSGRYHVPTFIELAWERGFDVELHGERYQPLASPTAGKFQLVQLRRITAVGQTAGARHAASGPVATGQ